MSIDIGKYSETVTNSKFDIQRKVVYAYVKSLLDSGDLNNNRENYKAYYQPVFGRESKFNFINSIDDNISLFQDSKSISAIAYSFRRKDLNLLQIIQDIFYTGMVRQYYSLDFRDDVPEFTDVGSDELTYVNATKIDENGNVIESTIEHIIAPHGTTDEEIVTDYINSIPIIAMYNFFYDNGDELSEEDIEVRNKIVGKVVQSYHDMISNKPNAEKLISILKPARVNIAFEHVPTIISGKIDGKSYCDGLFGEKSIAYCNPDIGEIKLEYFLNRYMNITGSASTNNISLCSEEQFPDYTFTKENDDCITVGRLFRIAYPSRPHTDDDIWGDINFNEQPIYADNGEILIDNVAGRVTTARIQKTSNIYFIWFVLVFPKH